MSVPKFRRLAVVPVAIGFLLRVTYLLRWRRKVELTGDPYFYYHQAKLLVEGKGFIHPFTLLSEQRVEQAADHPPLFPVLLAFLNTIGIKSVTQQMLVNCLIGTFSIVLAMLLARRLASDRTALVTGLFVAVNPNTFRYDGTLWSETLAIALMLVFVLVLHRFLSRPTVTGATLAGLCLGLATLTRAEYVLALPLVVVFFLWSGRKALGRHVRLIVAFSMAAFVSVAPWVAYNATRFEHPVGLTVGFQYLLPLTNCDSIYYGSTIGYWDVACLQPAYERTHAVGLDESELAREAAKDGLAYIGSHKRRAVVMPFLRVGRLVSLYQPIQQVNLDIFLEGVERPIAFSGLAAWFGLVVFGTVGAVSLRHRRRDLFVLVVPGLVIVTAAAATYGTTRFRAGFEPLGCILAAIGLQHMARFARTVMASSAQQLRTDER